MAKMAVAKSVFNVNLNIVLLGKGVVALARRWCSVFVSTFRILFLLPRVFDSGFVTKRVRVHTRWVNEGSSRDHQDQDHQI